MLNELHTLSNTLSSKGISIKEWHREYKPLRKVTNKAPCIRIWISNDGYICDIESIGAELAQSLRKYGNNQRTFPAFKIFPLYRITDSEQISALEDIEKGNTKLDITKIQSWCLNNNWRKSLINKVDNSIHNTAQAMLEQIKKSGSAQNNAVVPLINLVSGFTNEPDRSFRTALETCIYAKLQKREDVNLALSMLFHKVNPKAKDPEKDCGDLAVILDLSDWRHHGGYPVASGYTTEWINEILLISNQANTELQSETIESDAFGMPFVNPNEPMPSVKLSGFEVTLRSMFNGQPCQYRYNQIDDGSYPIANENRARTKQSLEWIAGLDKKSDREGVTWRKVDKNEIVFVYPSKLPDVLPRFASIFGSSQAENQERTKARFENVAEEFIKTLQGIPVYEKPDFIQIFTIRKIDKARSKVIFTHKCSPEQLILSAESWTAGCDNIPQNNLGKRATPFPLQVAKSVNNVWKQNGELAQGKTAVERMKYYQGMELLLDVMQESMVYNYLHILLVNSSGLAMYLGNWIHSGSKCKDKADKKNLEKLKQEAALLLSIIGLLLYKNNKRKEKYMENMAYLVGQILKISDELHTLYCKVVRNGDVPPQLAGSALFVAAGETPSQVLAQLSLRMNPYITWAKQYRFKNIDEKDKESWKAAWYLNLYENIANKLKLVMTDSIRFNDYDKAQLFIGYLSSFPKREHQSATAIDNNENNMEESSNDE
jgi:hypothetical protein